MKKNIVCMVGASGAGKGTVIEIMEKQGFKSTSLSNEVRRYAASLGFQDLTRSELQILANEARNLYGPDFFAKQAVQNTELINHSGLIIDGVRNLAELFHIKAFEGDGHNVVICSVEAEQELRYRRVLERGRKSDPMTWEEFLIADNRENGLNGNEFTQQNFACMQMADVRIKNEGSIDELMLSLQENLFYRMEGQSENLNQA